MQAVVERSHVDVLGFDACLMSMLETAYAVRRGAGVMVGSEELEPGLGWKYDAWLTPLVNDPSLDAAAVGRLVVQSYRDFYLAQGSRDAREATMSCTRLSDVEGLAAAVSELGDALAAALGDNAKRNEVAAARSDCANYAPDYRFEDLPRFNYVDLGRLCEALLARGTDPAVKSAAQNVLTRLGPAVVANWAGDLRAGGAVRVERDQHLLPADGQGVQQRPLEPRVRQRVRAAEHRSPRRIRPQPRHPLVRVPARVLRGVPDRLIRTRKMVRARRTRRRGHLR